MTPQERFAELVNLYEKMQFGKVVQKATKLASEYPWSFEVWNLLAAAHKSNGQLVEAERGFQKATELNPKFAEGHYNLGIALHEQGKIEHAICAYRRAIEADRNYAQAHYNMANSLREQGKLDEATAAYGRAIELNPEYAEAYINMGNSLRDQNRFEEAVESYQQAIKIRPEYAEAYYNMGTLQQIQGKLDEALEAYGRVVEINPGHIESLKSMGNSLKEQGKFDEAIETYERLIHLKQDDAEIYLHMGNTLVEQGKHRKALAVYQRAIHIKTDFADAYNSMGVALRKQSHLDESIEAYRCALQINPDFAEAHNNMGNALRDQGKLDDAVAAYRRSIEFKPDDPYVHNNMGVVLHQQGKFHEAIAAFRRALQITPTYAEAHNNMGNTLNDQGVFDEAIAAYTRALAIKADYAYAEAQILHLKRHICDWSKTEKQNEAFLRLGITTTAVTPFSMLSLEDNPERQLLRSRTWCNEQYKLQSTFMPIRPQVRPTRLRIGYFSADFHDHAVLFLVSGLLREHSKQHFEIFAFSYCVKKEGEMRRNLQNDVEHFLDVSSLSNSEIVNLARSKNLDFAIDLTGYTTNNRTELFQFRLAPIQINYLGYPSTSGADFIDYLVADRHLVPDAQRSAYSENIIYMPDTQLPTDNTRDISKVATARADFGLPDYGFVFCALHNSYKISPREFDIWMRLLQKVDGSVIWLLKSNQWAEQNLCFEAQSRGVNSSRLIFADKLPHDKYLARFQHADIFVDTFNHNAHTTACDALWAGLPIVTKQGQQFIARGAASLLHAAGLPELISQTEADYEALILDLAMNPSKLQGTKEKLAINRLTQPLFDTKRYTHIFEAGLTAAYELYFSNKEAQDIFVCEH